MIQHKNVNIKMNVAILSVNNLKTDNTLMKGVDEQVQTKQFLNIMKTGVVCYQDWIYQFAHYMIRNNNSNNTQQLKSNNSFQNLANLNRKTNSTSQSTSTLSQLKELDIDVSQCSPQLTQELLFLLNDVLKYPSAIQSQKHSQAHRLGLTDIIGSTADNRVYPLPSNYKENDREVQHCRDCGLIVQKESIPLCTSFKQFPHAGIGICLLFQTVKNIAILILILGCILSGYALYINYSQPAQTLDFTNFATKLSYVSIMTNLSTNSSLQTAIIIEGWLVVGVVATWILILVVMNVYQIKSQEMIDSNTVTAGDFTIMIENIPLAITQQQLQKQFDQYYDKLVKGNFLNRQDDKVGHPRFKIKKICKGIPYYLLEDEKDIESIQQMQNIISQYRQKFADWVNEFRKCNKIESISQEQRSKQYQQYQKLQQEKYYLQEHKFHTSNSQIHYQKVKQTVFFVTFQKSQSSNTICELNPQSIGSKIKYYLSCCSNVLFFGFTYRNQKLDIKLSRAPQPQDVIWNNIGMQFSSIVCRKFLTFFVTLVLLGASFGSVYGLTMLQLTSSNPILSYGASISITLINVIIAISIQKLTLYEKNMTKTSREISLAMKTIIAQIMNSILVPVIVNVYYQNNIYYKNGLVYDVFFLAITNALVPPILQLLNFSYIFSRLIAWYKKRPYPRLYLDQQKLNSYTELPEYQLGYAYIYYLNLYYFTCFYVTMQPFVVLPALIGIFMMYWIQKHRLLSRSRRPIPSTSLLADAMGQLVFFGPFVLSLGNITWYNLVTEATSNLSYSIFISHIAAVSMASIFFILPVDSLLHASCSQKDEEVLEYDQIRSQLKSEYDRLNPATKQEGFKDFMDFVKNKKDYKKNISQNEQCIFDEKQNQSKLQIDIFNVTQQELMQKNDRKLFIQDKHIFNQSDDHLDKDNNPFQEYQDKNKKKQNNRYRSYEPKPRRKTRKSHQLQPRLQIFQNISLKMDGYHSTKPKTKVEGNPYYDLIF